MSLLVAIFIDYKYVTQLASSSLLRLGQEVDKEAIKNRESIYLLLDLVSRVLCLLFMYGESSQ